MCEQAIQSVIDDLEIRTVSRLELSLRLGCTDREARRVISEIAKTRPVISLSDGRGYRIANKADDIEDARHAANENAKRAGEILKRNEALNQFLKSQGVTL